MPIHVKRIRVLRNMVLIAALSALVVWFGRGGFGNAGTAMFWGTVTGLGYAAFYWFRLVRRIERRERRHARNRVFVRFISPLEVLMAAAATSHYLLVGLLGLIMLMLIAGLATGHAWTLLVGSFGLSASLALIVCLLRYESRHGPVYYQYASSSWGGAEGLLYQTGTVVEALDPAGRVRVEGALWQARSLDGETIGRDEPVEVLDRDGLVLKVARLPTAHEQNHSSG